jgi:hypothetical protein
MRALRKMILGETWALPAAVAIMLAAALVLRAVAPDFWDDVGGFVLLGGAVAALTFSLPSPAHPDRAGEADRADAAHAAVAVDAADARHARGASDVA